MTVKELFEKRFLIFLIPTITMGSDNDPPPGSDEWETAVVNDLTVVDNSRVGNLLLRSIRFHGRLVRISPYPALPNVNACAADTRIPNPDFGATVQFTPGFYQPNLGCVSSQVRMGGYPVQSNETLVHELVHTLRMVSGKFTDKSHGTRLGGGLAFFDNREEFFAVLIQGIYASERKRPIRSSHFKHFEMDRELAHSYAFFKSGSHTYQLVKEFCAENPGFARALAEIEVPFNPIRAFYTAPAKAKAYSHSETANVRDHVLPLEKLVIDFIKEQFQ